MMTRKQLQREQQKIAKRLTMNSFSLMALHRYMAERYSESVIERRWFQVVEAAEARWNKIIDAQSDDLQTVRV